MLTRFRQVRHESPSRLGRTWLLVAFCGALLNAPSAIAVSFSLGDFANYGLLINNGVQSGYIKGSPIYADIGVGNIVDQIDLDNGTIVGRIDLRASTASADLKNFNGNTVNTNVTTAGSAITAASNLSTSMGTHAAAGTQITLGGTQYIDAGWGTQVGGSGARFFTTSTFSIGNGNMLIIYGSASDQVVINVTGTGNINELDGILALRGGIKSDNVLINFIGSSGSVSSVADGAHLEATFLIPNLAVNLNGLTIDGRLFGGASGSDFKFGNSAFVVESGRAQVPEPGTFGLLGIALVGIAYVRRRSSKTA